MWHSVSLSCWQGGDQGWLNDLRGFFEPQWFCDRMCDNWCIIPSPAHLDWLQCWDHCPAAGERHSSRTGKFSWTVWKSLHLHHLPPSHVRPPFLCTEITAPSMAGCWCHMCRFHCTAGTLIAFMLWSHWEEEKKKRVKKNSFCLSSLAEEQ